MGFGSGRSVLLSARPEFERFQSYCSPPLAMEREAVLEEYFEDIRLVEEDVEPATAWAEIEELPRLWDAITPAE